MQQVAIITGANQGIGSAIAFELAKNKIHVILIARDVIKLKEISDKISLEGGICSYYKCDITKQNEIDLTLRLIEEKIVESSIILVNNAGFGGPFHSTDEVSVEEWDLIFNTNVKAAFLFCKKLLPRMKENNFGRIINISSIYGIAGGACSSTYAASKHALIGYTKSLAVEWGSWNITCNSISPGYVDTKMLTASNESYNLNVISHIPSKRLASPDEIARIVAFLSKPDNGYINGANIVVDGGLLAGYNFI